MYILLMDPSYNGVLMQVSPHTVRGAYPYVLIIASFANDQSQLVDNASSAASTDNLFDMLKGMGASLINGFTASMGDQQALKGVLS
jgi:hypothetical protein